jgi:hypothetical protein
MVAAGVAEAGESLAAVMAHSMAGGCDSAAASRGVADDKSQLCVSHPACVRSAGQVLDVPWGGASH